MPSASSSAPAFREEVIFTARQHGRHHIVARALALILQPGDEILVTEDGTPLEPHPVADDLPGARRAR